MSTAVVSSMTSGCGGSAKTDGVSAPVYLTALATAAAVVPSSDKLVFICFLFWIISEGWLFIVGVGLRAIGNERLMGKHNRAILGN